MADSPNLPGSHSWPPSTAQDWRSFYGFLRDLVRFVQQTSGNTDSLTAILARLDALENAPEPDLGTIMGDMSVYVQGILGQDVQLRLVNDLPFPDDTHYYGTDADGVKGWHEHAIATLADVDLTGLVADDVLRWNGTAWVRQPASDFIVTLFDDANAGAVLTTLGVTAFAQTLLDDADAPTARATLDAASNAQAPVLGSLGNYVDDAAASAGGVPVGGRYRNGSVLMIRVT